MKYLTFFFIIIISASCCGTKQTSSKEIAQVVTPTHVEPPKTIEVIEIKSEVPPETKESITKTVVEVEKIQPLQFYQVLTKRILTQHELWNELLEKYVSEEGIVNYKGFKKDHEKLLGYITILQLTTPNNKSSKNEKLAYWINAYNAMTIDLIVRNYPIKSIKDIDKPWEQRLWKLGDTWYNLEDIEHLILRKMNEPRIHFAIVCASYSCPKLSNTAYTSLHLDSQLTQATKDFLSDPERNIITENSIQLSKIFSWFEKDFKQDGTLIDFLNQYSNVTISKNAKKRFKDYNWDLNE